jgi:hypothetical protein
MPPVVIAAVITAAASLIGAGVSTGVGIAGAARQRSDARKQARVQSGQQNRLVTEQDAEERRKDQMKRTARMDEETQALISRQQSGFIGQPLGSQTILGR